MRILGRRIEASRFLARRGGLSCRRLSPKIVVVVV
jgi:hypothetical protein